MEIGLYVIAFVFDCPLVTSKTQIHEKTALEINKDDEIKDLRNYVLQCLDYKELPQDPFIYLKIDVE